MADIFKNNIFDSIVTPPAPKYSLTGTRLPVSQEAFFVSKWHELFERYESARLFLKNAYYGEWTEWFKKSDENDIDSESDNNYKKWLYKSELFEMALISYNILVDLSWTITYVSAEFGIYESSENGNILKADNTLGMHTLDDSIRILHNLENKVLAPTAANNPYGYLMKMVPKFESAINSIINFWKGFADTNIRKLYNYIKHKGRPVYTEMGLYSGGKGVLIFGDNRYPIDIRDIQERVSIEEGINELISFDDDILFPYLEELIKELKHIVNPSPML